MTPQSSATVNHTVSVIMYEGSNYLMMGLTPLYILRRVIGFWDFHPIYTIIIMAHMSLENVHVTGREGALGPSRLERVDARACKPDDCHAA